MSIPSKGPFCLCIVLANPFRETALVSVHFCIEYYSIIIHLGFEIGVNKPITVNCLFLFAGATLVLDKGHLQPKGESPISRG